MQLEKRSNTVSGVPLNKRLPQQESVNYMPSFCEQKTQGEFLLTSQPAEESCSQDTTDNETHYDNSLRKESIDTSTPNHKKRSRHISDRLTTQSQRTSRSGSRSPSVHNLPSVNTSAYHSTSDLSTVSGGNVPQTERERNFILISKMLDVMTGPSSKMTDSESVSESGGEHNTPQLMTTLEQIREQYQQPERRSIESGSENTLERSQESGQGNFLVYH